MTHKYHPQPQDKQAALSGKSDNDFNKQGSQKPTQKNEGKRTPHSRGDRDQHIGTNQTTMRKGGPNQGQGKGSARGG
jgi:hypothetical protein